MAMTDSNSMCAQAEKYYYEYLSGQSEEGIPKKISDHIAGCEHCQAETNRLKDELETAIPTNSSKPKTDAAITTALGLHFAYIGTPVTCQTARLFLPSLADPVLKIGIPTPITVHLDKCQQCADDLETIRQSNLAHKQLCQLGQLFAEKPTAHKCLTYLEEIQSPHSAICNILEHKDSDIVTCFKMKDSVQNSIMYNSDDMYKNWPIEVQVSDKSKPDKLSLKDKQKVLIANSFRLIKPAAVAAVIILVAVFMLNTPVVRAVDLGQIYKALEQIKNVYFTTFVSGSSESTQEVWISQALNVKIFKNKSQSVLWDFANNFRKTKDLNTNSIIVTELSNDILTKIKKTMEVPWGLLPFEDISAVPEDAKWQKVTGENIDSTIVNTEIYDLTWVEKKLGGSLFYNKWRGYIDTETKLPMRVEQWRKRTGEEEYELLTITKIAYLNSLEIQTTINNTGF
ncbi:MAG: hypothetical protein KAS75_00235 [Planctomycetes bacterium]|nr:hypothetical protein [Planctomycetota bacterium]